MLDDDLAAPVPALDDAVGNALRLVVGEHGKQRHTADQVEVRKHCHTLSSNQVVVATARKLPRLLGVTVQMSRFLQFGYCHHCGLPARENPMSDSRPETNRSSPPFS